MNNFPDEEDEDGEHKEKSNDNGNEEGAIPQGKKNLKVIFDIRI